LTSQSNLYSVTQIFRGAPTQVTKSVQSLEKQLGSLSVFSDTKAT